MIKQARRTKQTTIGPSLLRGADRLIFAIAGLVGLAAAYGAWVGKGWTLTVALGLVAMGLCLLRRASPVSRVQTALWLAFLIVLVYGAEVVLAVFVTASEPAYAAKRGIQFDARTVADVVRDLRAEGRKADAQTLGHTLLIEGGWPRLIGGRETLPLVGAAYIATVVCREGGRYLIVDSDRHGYSNPDSVWDLPVVDVALIGDSTTFGFCVAPADNLASVIRQRFPATLNLGAGGNGPLLNLAAITEYVIRVRPRHVLWLYSENDPADLRGESEHAIMRRYLDPSFSQGLMDRQEVIDRAIIEYLASKVQSARRWPDSLQLRGISRAYFPTFLQELITSQPPSTPEARIAKLFALRKLLESLHEVEMPSEDIFLLFEKVLGEAKRRVETGGGHFYFVYLPSYPIRPNGKVRGRVLAAARSQGIPIHDVTPAFAALADVTPMFSRDGRVTGFAHYNEAGHRLAGESVVRFLDDVVRR